MKGHDAPQKGDPADLRKLTLVSPLIVATGKTQSDRRSRRRPGKFVCEYRGL
jgi:hypothetical protein